MQMLFIHGRAQHGRNGDEIRGEWSGALNIALKRRALGQIGGTPMVPFYGDLLFSGVPSLEAADPDAAKRSTQSGEFENFVDDYIHELAARKPELKVALPRVAASSDPDLSPRQSDSNPHADPDLYDRAFYNWPRVVAAVRLLDSQFPCISAGGIALILKDVHDYLTNGRLRTHRRCRPASSW